MWDVCIYVFAQESWCVGRSSNAVLCSCFGAYMGFNQSVSVGNGDVRALSDSVGYTSGNQEEMLYTAKW